MDRIPTSLFRCTACLAAAILIAVSLYACDKSPAPAPSPEHMAPVAPAPASTVPEEVKGPEPTKQTIKFRRNKDNTYSWEITGEDVDRVTQADKKLRKYTEGAPVARPGWTDGPDK